MAGCPRFQYGASKDVNAVALMTRYVSSTAPVKRRARYRFNFIRGDQYITRARKYTLIFTRTFSIYIEAKQLSKTSELRPCSDALVSEGRVGVKQRNKRATICDNYWTLYPIIIIYNLSYYMASSASGQYAVNSVF